MNKKNLSLCIVAAALLVGLSVWYFSDKKQPEKYTGSVEKITLGMPAAGPEVKVLIFIAEERGYFAENGLEVKILDEVSSVTVNQSLRDGKIDIGTTSDFTFVNSSFEDSKLAVLISMAKLNTLKVVGRIDKGINQPADLKGKKIGIIPKTVQEFYLDRVLISHNLSKSEVKIVTLHTPDQLLQSLVKGEVDAILASSRHASQLKGQLKEKVLIWSAQENQPFHWLVVINRDANLRRQEAFRRFVASMVQAEEYLKADEKSALEIIGNQLSAQDKDYLLSDWQNFQFNVSLDQSFLLLMEDEARWSIANKLTNETQVPNYLDYIYFDALETVKPEAVTIVH